MSTDEDVKEAVRMSVRGEAHRKLLKMLVGHTQAFRVRVDEMIRNKSLVDSIIVEVGAVPGRVADKIFEDASAVHYKPADKQGMVFEFRKKHWSNKWPVAA